MLSVKDMFSQVLTYQKRLGYNYTYPNLYKRMEHFRHLALAMQAEVIETLDWLPWKPWRTLTDQGAFNGEIAPDKRREAALEIVDQQFFLINQWHCLGYKEESFEELFKQKLEENNDRIDRKYNHTEGMGHAGGGNPKDCKS